MAPSSNIFPLSRRRGRTHEDSRWRGGIRPSFRRLQRLAGSIDIKKGRRGAVVGYCPCSIIMRLIQIDDCRRLFARSLRICEWRRIIRAARLSVRRSHAALHVGLIFNRRCVQNAGRYARTGSRAKPPPCPDNNQRVTPILSLLAQYWPVFKSIIQWKLSSRCDDARSRGVRRQLPPLSELIPLFGRFNSIWKLFEREPMDRNEQRLSDTPYPSSNFSIILRDEPYIPITSIRFARMRNVWKLSISSTRSRIPFIPKQSPIRRIQSGEGNSARLPFDFDSRIEMAIRACINQLAEYQSAIGGRKRAKTGRRESNYPSHYYESGTVHSFRSPGGPEDDERIHLEGRGGKLI